MNPLTDNSRTTHGVISERSLIDHIGKGREGKGNRKGSCLSMLHRLTGAATRPVDNPHASASAAPTPTVECDAFGEIRRWSA